MPTGAPVDWQCELEECELEDAGVASWEGAAEALQQVRRDCSTGSLFAWQHRLVGAAAKRQAAKTNTL